MSDTEKITHHQSEERTTVETLTVPVSLLEKMSEAAELVSEIQDELEDYLFSQNADFLERMRQARKHHQQGETRSLDALKVGHRRDIYGKLR